MQTFLPSDDFATSARVLDTRRLGKQRVEVLQIFRAITRPQYGWRNHPAVRMWRGYEEALLAYGLAVCREWASRGHEDTVRGKLLDEWAAWSTRVTVRSQAELAEAGELPPWLGVPEFHRSHQSALMRKDRTAYAAHYGEVPDDLPYHWPA